MDASGEIRFDGWTVRRQPRELLRDGKRIRLQDQPLQILVELLTHPGELVTREHLIAQLWPKRIVDFDTALNTAVRRLRAALGDEAETPRYIETTPRQGYRFIGTVVSAAPPTPAAADGTAPSTGDPSRRRRQWTVIAALVVVLGSGAIVWQLRDREVAPLQPAGTPAAQAALKSIAVLPFADLSPEQDQQHFSEGLSEEILNLLAQSPQLRVIARTSSFSFKEQNVDIATVAGKLNVTHVLEGSVRKSGDRLRITAQLIDAATSSHLWSQTYDRGLDDIFEVQSDIAASVASALRIALGGRARLSAPGNAQVYERFLRAKFFFQRRRPGDLERARQYYQQALDIEPDFARAWAGLAGVYWIQMNDGVLARDTGLEKLRDAAERALSLDPALAEAHIRLMNYMTAIGDRNAAREHRRRASALAPNNPLVLGVLAGDAAEDGRWDEAIELQRRAVAADPLSTINRDNLADFLFLGGRFDEAKIESSRLLELDPSYVPDIDAFILILERRFEEALHLIQALPDSVERAQCLALVYYALGRKADADAALEELIAFSARPDPLRIAEVYAYRGDIEEAFQWLEKTEAQGGAMAYFHSPFLKRLHTDARWQTWRTVTR